ncbi:MAG: hypothetical protein XD81_0744, partial [Bacteroidetes bacterium 38_7]
MITHHQLPADRDVHRAAVAALVAGNAGGFIAPDLEDPEQVGHPQHRAIGAGIFAPRALHKQGAHQGQAQHHQPGHRHLTAPEVEQREIRVHLGEHQPAG